MFSKKESGRLERAKSEDVLAGNFVAKIKENRNYLKTLAGKRPPSTELQRRFLSWLDEPTTMTVPVLEEEFLVHALFNLGRYPEGFDLDTGLIEDNVVTSILVSALSSRTPAVREYAFRYLLDFGREDQISIHSAMIKEALADFKFPDQERFLALLPLSQSERLELLQRKNLALDVRARLGDKQAEEELIERFFGADSFERKREMAVMLGYAGTSSCASALIRSLDSPLMLIAPYEHVSIRVYIIIALGRIHPNEMLLTREIMKIVHLGDDKYGGKERIRDYLIEVKNWGLATYGVFPDGPEPEPILFKMIIVKHPIKK
jgi:hypothetical protein